MKKHTLIFTTLIFLLLPFWSIGQSITPNQLLNKTAKSLKKINSVVYKINRTDKHFSSKDTLTSTALCSLYIVPKDKIGMYYVINTKAKTNAFNHERYNGKEYSFIHISKDLGDTLIKAKNFELINVTKKDYVSGNYNIKFLAYEIFNSKKNISKYNSLTEKLSIKEFIIKETYYSETPVYELTIIHKSNENKTDEITNMVEKYYIRKTDYLPVGYVFNGDFEGMKGYENYTIEYIKINPELTIEDFKIDTNSKKVTPEVLFDNVNKHKL